MVAWLPFIVGIVRRTGAAMWRAWSDVTSFAWNNPAVLGLAVFVAVGWLSPRPFPNVFGFSDPSALTALLSTIATSLAAILGFIVALLLVAFEALRRTYTSYAVQEVFRTPEVKHLFVLYLSTIGLSLITLGGVAHQPTLRTVNLTYLSLGLSLTCLAVLYPLSRGILSNTRAKAVIRKIADGIGGEALATLGAIRHPTVDSVDMIENNPLFVLSEVAGRTIDEGDRLTPRVAILETTGRLVTLLRRPAYAEGRRDIINAFLIVFGSAARHAIAKREEGTLYTIIAAFEEIHRFGAKNKFAWSSLIELNEALGDMLRRAVEAGLEEVVAQGMWALGRIAKAHLTENVPPESELSLFQPGGPAPTEASVEKTLQWNHVAEEYLRMMADVGRAAVDAGEAGAASYALHGLGNLMGDVIEIRGLGDRQKTYVVTSCCYFVQVLTISAAKNPKTASVQLYIPLSFLAVDRALDKNALFSKKPLLHLCGTLVELAELRVLNSCILNELGALGRHCVQKVEESQLHAEALLLICNVFAKLAENFEKPQNPDEVRVLREVLSQVDSFKSWFRSEAKHHATIEARIGEILGRLEAAVLAAGDADSQAVPWPDLSPSQAAGVERPSVTVERPSVTRE